jgi:SAM-dependent methyltransferase
MDIGEIRRCLQVLRGQYTEQPEGIEMTYDPLYGKPLTGELGKDGFKTAPNVILVESMKSIGPGGKALDVGAGMGRNGVYLAKLGWEVTGIDLSAQGLAVMKAGAEKAGLKVETIKTSYEDYDFGKERWDLLAMILSWAPIEDPALLARLKASIKPGGYVVFEHVTQREKDPFPPGVHAPAPGALRESCSRTSRSSSTGSSTTTATGAGRQPATSAWSPASAAERPEVHSLIGGRLPGIGPEAGPNPTFSLEGEPGFM